MNIDMNGAVEAFSGFGLKTLNKELALADMPKAKTIEVAVKMVIGANQIRSQGEIAALAVNLSEGSLTAAQLNEIFALVFPTAKLDNGRHGGHWLCHCRNGKVVGYQPRYYVAKVPERKAATKLGIKADGYTDVDDFRKTIAEAKAEATKAAETDETDTDEK